MSRQLHRVLVVLLACSFSAALWSFAGSVAADAGAHRSIDSPVPSEPLHQGQWPMFKGRSDRQSRTPLVGPQSSNLLWRVTLGAFAGPIIGRDGTIYAAGSYGMAAYRPDGTHKWTAPSRDGASSEPAILLDGRIVFVDDRGTIYAVNPDGTPSWARATGLSTGPHGQPAIGADGTIYLVLDNWLVAVRPDGAFQWSFDTGWHSGVGQPAVARDGTIYVGANGVDAVSPQGELVWRFELPPGSIGYLSAPAVAAEGTIYVNSLDPAVYAVNPDGSLRWRYPGGGGVDFPSSPAIGKEGTIYTTDAAYQGLMALNPDGSLKWRYPIEGIPTTPAVGGDGTVYFGDREGRFFGVGEDGTLKWMYADEPGSYNYSNPPGIGLGRRLIGTSFSGLFAIGP